MQQLAISAQECDDVAMATRLLNRHKFDAVVVDLATDNDAAQVLEHVRVSLANKTAVTFAISDARTRSATSQLQANFVMEKPLSSRLIESTLRAALGSIIREHRRYFRCPTQIPSTIRIPGATQLACEIVNISEGGLAVTAPAIFKPGAQVQIQFALPGQSTVVFEIDSEICWCDNKGRSGLHFRSVSAEQKAELRDWLFKRLEETLPVSVARLFEKSE